MWDERYESELADHLAAAEAGGGEARVAKQHATGKLTARERVALLFDPGTFVEICALREARPNVYGDRHVSVSGDGVVVGYGKVAGRPVYASSEDFTVNGGSLGEVHSKKICQCMDMAMNAKAPFVSINDSGGARIDEGVCSLSGYSGMFLRNTRASGVIPQIAVILGPCAGGACYSLAICDFIFMTRETSKMFITGPAVIKTVTHEDVTFEELGGAAMHSSVSGVAHFVYEDDAACIAGVRELLCEQASGYVVCANYNSPAQIVVSGETQAVDSLLALLKERKVRAMKLPVSAPFHCELMAPAADAVAEAASTLPLGEPKLPVYMNVDASPLAGAAELPAKMAAQAKSPVRWRQTLERMWADGFTHFLECGPGTTLSGFVKKTLPEAEVLAIG